MDNYFKFYVLSGIWIVTPLIGDFGGRVGIYRFLKTPLPPLECSPLSLFAGIFSHLNCVDARLHALGLIYVTSFVFYVT